MKKTLLAVLLLVCFALPATAKNSVNVTGDILKDGKLTIDVDWTIDSSKYPGLSREAVRRRVSEEIRSQAMPKIVAAAQGMAVSLDQGNFTLVKENTELVERRPNGAKIYAYNLTMEFSAPSGGAASAQTSAATTATAPAKKPAYETAMNQRWQNEL